MDVRCTKCGIEYEFDDAKVTAAGVTVKCTSCGHVFKVKREEALPSPQPFGPGGTDPFARPVSTFAKGMDGGEWMVKRTDGQVFRFKELTTLQKWIVERKVGRDDEISKTGKTWKRLGEISELASFFQVVDAANAAVQQASLPPQPPAAMAMPLPTQLPTQPGTTTPSAMPNTNPGLGQTMAPPSSPQPAPAHDPQPAAPTAPAVPVRPTQPTVDGVSQGASQRAAERAEELDALDDDDPVLQMIQRRRRNAALAFVGVILVGAGVAGWAFWPQVSTVLGIAQADAPAGAVDEARKAIRADGRAVLARTSVMLGSLSQTPVVVAWHARVSVAIAGQDLEVARLHEALAAAGATLVDRAGAAAQARAQANVTLSSAYAAITKLRADAPKLVDAHLASAAYQLQKGAFPELRADLEAARSLSLAGGKPDAAVDSEIAVLQALADGAAGLAADPGPAFASAPSSSDDGRLRYLRAALAVAAAGKKAPGAEAELEAARVLVEGLPRPDTRADLLAELVVALTPKKAPAVVDAGPAVAAPASTDAGPAQAAAPEGPDAPPPDDGTDEPNAIEAASYEVIMQKAERARLNERSRVAFDLFGKATRLKPGSSRPWLGLGWAALDLGKNKDAIRAFEKAIDLDESNSDAQFGLAEAYNFAGKKAEALEAYRTYVKMDPNGKDAAVARRAIDSLD